MTFQVYLDSTRVVAAEELEVLDLLSSKSEWDKIELRAAKNSMQVVIENCIGKAKRILKKYDCPVVPQKGRDVVAFMYEIGLIDDDLYSVLNSAIGLRNAMIHDYMNFDDAILHNVIHAKKYLPLIDFLMSEPNYTTVLRSRIENFFLQ